MQYKQGKPDVTVWEEAEMFPAMLYKYIPPPKLST